HVVENLRVGSVDDLKRKNASGTRRNESVIGDVVPCCAFESDAAVRHATNGIVDYCHICRSRSKVNTYGNIATNIRHHLTANYLIVLYQDGSERTRQRTILYNDAVPVKKNRTSRVNSVVGYFYPLRNVLFDVWFNINRSHALRRISPRILESIPVDRHVPAIHNGHSLACYTRK